MNNMTFLDKMKAAVGHVKAAQDIVSSRTLMFYLEKMIAHSEALMTFCPFRVGDRAVISGEIEGMGGATNQDKTLATGQEGDVVGIDWVAGVFVIDFVPDERWYRSYGKWVSGANSSVFDVTADVLSPLNEMSGV